MIITTATGNVGRADFKEVGDTSLLEFSIASTERSKDNEYTTWLTCKLWGKRAEALQKYIDKGTALVVTGALREESWEKDGEKRTKHVLNVDKLDFQRGGKSEGGYNGATKPASPSQDDAFEDDENLPF